MIMKTIYDFSNGETRQEPLNDADLAALPSAEQIARDNLCASIVALEAQVTPRRLREAVLGADAGWLAALEAQIASLRAQL